MPAATGSHPSPPPTRAPVAASTAAAYPGEVTRLVPALALALAACQADPGATDTGDESTGTTGEPTPSPAFLNPAVGSFQVDATQTAPEVLVVQHVMPGLTQVLLDGYALGLLPDGNPLGTLADDRLTLLLHGALTAGKHTMQLMTPGPDGPRFSVTLTMEVVPPTPDARPTWAVELDPEPLLGDGAALFASGTGAGGVLGVLVAGDPWPEVRLYRGAADGWQRADPVAMPLDGHVPTDMSLGPAVSAVAFPEADGGAPKRMRVVHTVGLPAHTVVSRDVWSNPDPIVLDPVVAFDLSSALGDSTVEYAAFDRPVALGHTLVAELTAAADAEQPHPGDRRLISSFWRGELEGWTPPRRVGTATPTDLDALGPAPVLSDISGAPASALAVRLGGAFPGVLEVRDNGATAITTPPLTAPLDVAGQISLATIVSNFGSRTVAAVDRDGRVSLGMFETQGGNVPRLASPRAADLTAAPPTGPLAPGVGRGFPFFMIPYGDAAPVHVIVGDGDTSFVVTLDDLHCDALALAVTLAGNDPDAAAVPLACLSHGELRLGRVTITPPT